MEKEILTLIEKKQYGRLRSVLSEMNPTDLAFVFEEVQKRELPMVFRILPKELAAEVFVEMDTDMQRLLIDTFNDQELSEVMNELFMDDTVDIIDEMPASVAKRILKHTDKQTRALINQLLACPEDSAGSIMTTEYVDLKAEMTVEDAFERIRKIGVDTETIYTCYVMDSQRHLLGLVTVKELLLSPKEKLIGEIMEENVIYANTHDDREEVAALFDKYDFLALPIVDKENRLVGIVTVDDAIDVLQEEISEDFEKMAAILPTEHAYLKTGVFETFKARIPWLLFLMLSATFTGAIISLYESKLTLLPALIAYIPMLMGTGGNSGSQSSVTVIRGLSIGDIEFKDIFRVICKEIRVGFVCGTALCVINFIKLYLIDYLLLHNFDIGKAIPEMITICITLFFTVIVAKFVGTVLPIFAKRIGLDPAVMASPLVTTILDAVSLFIYFYIAGVLIGI